MGLLRYESDRLASSAPQRVPGWRMEYKRRVPRDPVHDGREASMAVAMSLCGV
jgi:hypothetical protein